jgi:phosphoglycolate phosphatase-like HAD superfamily hydrolase
VALSILNEGERRSIRYAFIGKGSRGYAVRPAGPTEALIVNLVIFDIDGTLTATNQVDTRCFAGAFLEVFGIEISTDWQSYPHRTDSGIISHNCRIHLGRHPIGIELERFRNRFLALLEREANAAPWDFAEVPGAGAAIARIEHEAGYAIALATGGWRVSARFKLDKARLPIAHLPAAFADDAEEREEIARRAINRAELHYLRSFDRVILAGDSDCDLATAARLGLSFVGIAADGQDGMLREAGAEYVLRDYEDLERVMSALAAATPPK